MFLLFLQIEKKNKGKSENLRQTSFWLTNSNLFSFYVNLYKSGLFYRYILTSFIINYFSFSIDKMSSTLPVKLEAA